MHPRAQRAPPGLAALVAALALLAGCGPGSEAPSGEASRERAAVGAAGSAASFAGLYRASGKTVDVASGDTRLIHGTVVLKEADEGYLASAELHTRYPHPGGGEIAAEVIGTGKGRRQGATLSGRAETQLVLGSVPGVDTGFAFVPREVGPRIVSTWSAERAADGSLRIEFRNEPGQGEDYRPTRTTLRAERIAAAD